MRILIALALLTSGLFAQTSTDCFFHKHEDGTSNDYKCYANMCGYTSQNGVTTYNDWTICCYNVNSLQVDFYIKEDISGWDDVWCSRTQGGTTEVDEMSYFTQQGDYYVWHGHLDFNASDDDCGSDGVATIEIYGYNPGKIWLGTYTIDCDGDCDPTSGAPTVCDGGHLFGDHDGFLEFAYADNPFAA